MAQIPKTRLVKGPYKPICRDCAIYFAIAVTACVPPGTLNNQFLVDGNGDFQPFFHGNDLVHHPTETSTYKSSIFLR